MGMQYSQNGLNFTEGFEGCKLAAYLDQGGVPTIGFGHTKGVQIGDTCTKDEANSYLLQDVQSAVDEVNRVVKVPLTQPEFDALVDFTFNEGDGAFSGSTMLRLLNSGDFVGCANQFDAWDKEHINGASVVVAGLLRRRQGETGEFDTGMANAG